MITIQRRISFARRKDRTRRLVVHTAPPPPPIPVGRVPRVARLMALAVHFDDLIRAGTVRDQSDLARLVHVTQPRMTQILNLALLAPDIQEDLLSLPLVVRGRDPLTERDLRAIVAELIWNRQRQRWSELKSRTYRIEQPQE